ncbi:MAG: hypothetical protein ACLQME_12590 [Alphaproteobacteria bacterium]
MTKKITRRDALAGLAGAVALAPVVTLAAVPAPPAPPPDAELLALEPEWRAANAAANAEGLTDAERDPLSDAFFDIEEEIAEADAHTLEGLAFKLRAFLERMRQWNDLESIDGRFVVTALEAVARIAAGGVS